MKGNLILMWIAAAGGQGPTKSVCIRWQGVSSWNLYTLCTRAIMKWLALIQSEPISEPPAFICLVFGELNRIATFTSVKNWQKTLNEFWNSEETNCPSLKWFYQLPPWDE